MKVIKLKLTLFIFAGLVITSTICIMQQMWVGRIKENERRLAVQYQELSTNYAALLEIVEARDAEILRLHNEAAEILSLRNQSTQSREQAVASATENQAEKTGESDKFTGYLTKEQVKFVGFDSPESAFQSWAWASMNSDYTNWLASLSPHGQEEESADPQSKKRFQDGSRLRGMQVLATKPVGSDRMELKVRLDTENSVAILIFPMVAIGNEWKLGDDIQSYTETWDHSADSQ